MGLGNVSQSRHFRPQDSISSLAVYLSSLNRRRKPHPVPERIRSIDVLNCVMRRFCCQARLDALDKHNSQSDRAAE